MQLEPRTQTVYKAFIRRVARVEGCPPRRRWAEKCIGRTALNRLLGARFVRIREDGTIAMGPAFVDEAAKHMRRVGSGKW